MIDFQTIFSKYNIPIATSGRHKRTGWINTTCPLCTGSEGQHRGFHIESGVSICYRCGKYPTDKALSLILKVDINKAKQLIRQNSTGFIKSSFEGFKPEVEQVDVKKLNLQDLLPFHRKYLENRGYDVDRLIHFFGLKSTGYKTDPFFYQNKIFIPYYLNYQLMTYTTRDISVGTKQENMSAKYITCKKSESLTATNHIIYNFDNIKHRKNKRTLFFEGPLDCANFFECAGSTSGIKFPPQQVQFIIDHFNYPVFILDSDSAGEEASQKAFDEIEVLTGKAPEVYSLEEKDRDPGDLNQQEVTELLKILDIDPR